MNKEKLYNAARSEAFDLVDCAHKTDSHDLVEAFVQGAEWLMAQPLSARLTEEEKEKIIKRYKDELEMAQCHTEKMKKSVNHTSIQFHANLREDYISRLKLLEKIFGKEMFEPKNNKI